MRWYKWLDEHLQGQPDAVVSLLLLILAVSGVAIALFGPRPLKVAVLAYWVFP